MAKNDNKTQVLTNQAAPEAAAGTPPEAPTATVEQGTLPAATSQPADANGSAIPTPEVPEGGTDAAPGEPPQPMVASDDTERGQTVQPAGPTLAERAAAAFESSKADDDAANPPAVKGAVEARQSAYLKAQLKDVLEIDAEPAGTKIEIDGLTFLVLVDPLGEPYGQLRVQKRNAIGTLVSRAVEDLASLGKTLANFDN